tara:strand:- start:400 stop:987 length:588 start_codon:yes stop_codon:yes gene_type:complete
MPSLIGTKSNQVPTVGDLGTMAFREQDQFLDLAGTQTVSGTKTFSEIITASKGVAFPATQVASANANTLDDYEEGTWTPIDSSGASLSFSSATGHYTKVGRLVTLTAVVTYPTTASTSSAQIGGFPFANAIVAGGSALPTGGFLIGSDCGLNLNFRIGAGAATSTLISSGGTFTAVTNVNLTAKQVQFIYVYYSA